jgi:hypothetical protein
MMLEKTSSLCRGDNRGDSAHQRWLALVSVQTSKTRINWRSPALAGASSCPFNPQVVGPNPSPVILLSQELTE